jgi:hypothetical protein
MPWDLLDKLRDEDATDRRRWTRRLRKRGGRRTLDASQAKAPTVAQEEGSNSGMEEQAQDKTPAEILDIVDTWLEDNSPENVEIFSWQVVYAEHWAKVKAWRDKQ